MRRREFPRALGSMAVSWPLIARAQSTGKTYRIGIVEPISAELNFDNIAALRQGLRDLGYHEGHNTVLEFRSADRNATLFPGLVAELLGLNVDLI